MTIQTAKLNLLIQFTGTTFEEYIEAVKRELEMTITHVRPVYKQRITSIVVKEFGGIDHLPDALVALKSYPRSS